VFAPTREELWALLERSAAAVVFCDADRVHYVNDSFLALAGCPSREDALTLRLIDDLIAPANREASRTHLGELLNGSPTRHIWRVQIARTDGALVDAVAQAEGATIGGRTMVCLTLAEPALIQQQQAQLETLAQAVDNVHEAIVMADPQMGVVYYNRAAARLMGDESGELMGRDVRTLVSPSELEQMRAMERKWEAAGVASGERIMRRLNGEEFPAHLTITIVRDHDGMEVARIGIFHDITARRQAEDERELRRRHLALMLREAHHRTKNTLQLASDLLVLQSATGEPQVRAALQSASERLWALSAVHQWFSPEQDVPVVDAAEMIRTVVGSLRGSVVDTGEVIDLEVAAEALDVGPRDATALALITTELLTNAIRHGSPSAIAVRCSCSRGEATLEVADDGPSPSPNLAGRPGGFGLELVRLLAEEQLRGSFSLERIADHTVARVSFPIPTVA
jgi:PAS domain S-box-containing protein